MLASGIGIGLGVDLGKCNPDLGELGMTIANQGTCQPWHDLAYLPRGPREPNAPSRAKSRQLTCHLPDGLMIRILILSIASARESLPSVVAVAQGDDPLRRYMS